MSALRDAHDHFLTNVTALGERDRPIFDPGLERDGVLVHVHKEKRGARFDPQHVERFESGLNRAGRENRVHRWTFIAARNEHSAAGHAAWNRERPPGRRAMMGVLRAGHARR